MRVIGEIPHPVYKITLFAWNGKYLLKIEARMLEQTYKVSELDIISPDEVKSLLDDVFMAEVSAIFEKMHESLAAGLSRINTFE
jgi:hypothetical protein